MSYVTKVEQLTMEPGVAQPVDKGLTRGREIGSLDAPSRKNVFSER
jgi:hypothetical protein